MQARFHSEGGAGSYPRACVCVCVRSLNLCVQANTCVRERQRDGREREGVSVCRPGFIQRGDLGSYQYLPCPCV